MKPITNTNLSALLLAVSMALGTAIVSTSPAMAAIAPKEPPKEAPKEAAKLSVSKPLSKPLGEAQKAIQAKKFDEALAKVAEAEAMPVRTPYDTFAIAQMRAYAYSQTGRIAEAIPSYLIEVDSGFLSPEDADRLARGVTALYYEAKDFPNTIDYGQKVAAAGRADADTWFRIAHAYFLTDKFADSIGVVKQYLADAAKKGQKPAENTLLLQLQCNVRLRDNPGTVASLGQLAEHYGKPEYWHDLLVTMRDTAARGSNQDLYTLNIYRLMRETGSLKESVDFLEMAQLAVSQGSPGEAVDAISRGQKADAFRNETDKHAAGVQLATAQKLSDADRAGLAKFEVEAKAGKTGEGDVRLGQAYLSYDQADKATEAIQRGIGKGGLRNADEAQILLGISLLRLGRKDEAAAAFAATKGTDARLGNLARLWGLQARR
jgi:tetratricopeptide (TPR) repeat protein